ncbi:hypothetical protein MN608_05228 [Microdochium nivale]|nr:hypothetical protein MN608_05228 [Microdochium nivale]
MLLYSLPFILSELCSLTFITFIHNNHFRAGLCIHSSVIILYTSRYPHIRTANSHHISSPSPPVVTMKFSAITSVLCLATSAVLAAPAAPAPVTERATLSLDAFNNFRFANLDLAYLQAVNGLDLQALANLQLRNNLDLAVLQGLFRDDVFSVDRLLQLQQVALLSQLSAAGAFPAGLDLSRLQLAGAGLKFAQLGLVAGFPLGSLIDQRVQPQLKVIVQQAPPITIII